MMTVPPALLRYDPRMPIVLGVLGFRSEEIAGFQNAFPTAEGLTIQVSDLFFQDESGWRKIVTHPLFIPFTEILRASIDTSKLTKDDINKLNFKKPVRGEYTLPEEFLKFFSGDEDRAWAAVEYVTG